jgi:outer membrane biosynthesis protein TonB
LTKRSLRFPEPVLPKRPINADVPAPDEGEKETPAAEKPKAEAQPTEKPQAQPEPDTKELKAEPKPAAPKVLAGLVVLALVFIVVAIVGSGSGSDKADTSVAPAPAPAASGNTSSGSAAQTTELGYPSFATNNTTRIGGSDPATNAAGVALAVFPSTSDEQRPAAVTLVGEEDWAGAIAASVLMAPPIRAPLLFSAPDEMPAVSEEALDALDPQGSKDTQGISLFVVGQVVVPNRPGKGVPIDSGDPASTAAQIATLRDELFGGPPAHIVIASSSQPDFAMPAAAWAARSGDPVLYAEAKKLPAPTAEALKKHPQVPVFVLGPDSAISAGVVAEIEKISTRVKRVAGPDPVANALALARYRAGDFGWNVNDPGHGFVLTRSDSPADAAASAPLSASGTWGPLLLTDGAGALPDAVRNYLLDVKPGYTTDPTRAFYNRVWVIGGQDAIGVEQQAEVNELAELAKIGKE